MTRAKKEEETPVKHSKPHEQLGLVSKIMKAKGFGFITGDDEEQYFFHAAAVRGGMFDQEEFCEGTRVRFIVTGTPKGPRALNVVALGEGRDG
jgi:cold shock CspA family protein